MKKLKISAAVVLFVLVVIVIFQNTEPVETRLLFATFTMPRAALLASTMLIGVTGGIFVGISLAKRLPRKRR